MSHDDIDVWFFNLTIKYHCNIYHNYIIKQDIRRKCRIGLIHILYNNIINNTLLNN